MPHHRCQLKVSLAVETAAIQTKPAQAGYQIFDFSLVRVGGLRFSSREFYSLGLKLTPMAIAHPSKITDDAAKELYSFFNPKYYRKTREFP